MHKAEGPQITGRVVINFSNGGSYVMDAHGAHWQLGDNGTTINVNPPVVYIDDDLSLRGKKIDEFGILTLTGFVNGAAKPEPGQYCTHYKYYGDYELINRYKCFHVRFEGHDWFEAYFEFDRRESFEPRFPEQYP